MDMEHPDDSLLLAYALRQLAEDESGAISQHVAACPQCIEHLQAYEQISSLLSQTLKSAYWQQPAGTVAERVFGYIADPEAGRLARLQKQREQLRRDVVRCGGLIIQPFVALLHAVGLKLGLSKRSEISENRAMAPVPVFSIPAVVFLVSLVAFVAFAYSLRGTANFNGHLLPNAFTGATEQTNAIIKGHTMPTQGIGPTNTPINSVDVTAQATSGGPKPVIKQCTQWIDRFFGHFRICGSHFPAGDKVQLIFVLQNGQTRQGDALFVNKQGNFQVFWTVMNCKQIPVAVYARDISSQDWIGPAVVKDSPFGRCFVPPLNRGTNQNWQPPGDWHHWRQWQGQH
jgi:hypothetical protein